MLHHNRWKFSIFGCLNKTLPLDLVSVVFKVHFFQFNHLFSLYGGVRPTQAILTLFMRTLFSIAILFLYTRLKNVAENPVRRNAS